MHIYIDSNIDQSIANKLMDTNFAGTPLVGTPETDEDYATGIVVTQRETYTADDLPTPDDKANDGNSWIAQYNLADATIFVETGENHTLGIFPVGATILDYLSEWEFDNVERAVGLARFGFELEYEEADEDDTEVRIWCVPNYCPGTLCAPHANFVMEDTCDHTPKVFATYSDAQDWIDDADSSSYLTSHGEMGRPKYIIVN